MPRGAGKRRLPQPLLAKSDASAGRCNIHAAMALPGHTASCQNLGGQQAAEERLKRKRWTFLLLPAFPAELWGRGWTAERPAAPLSSD